MLPRIGSRWNRNRNGAAVYVLPPDMPAIAATASRYLNCHKTNRFSEGRDLRLVAGKRIPPAEIRRW